MMELRPMVVNSDNIVLGGNMRVKALKELGYKEVPKEWIKSADDLTEDEQREFIIKDNIGFGEHDWEMLQAEWDLSQLEEWGLDVPEWAVEPDFDELIADNKDKPATMKITFESPEQLQKAENDIQELLDRKYEGAFYSVSAGEI